MYEKIFGCQAFLHFFTKKGVFQSCLNSFPIRIGKISTYPTFFPILTDRDPYCFYSPLDGRVMAFILPFLACGDKCYQLISPPLTGGDKREGEYLVIQPNKANFNLILLENWIIWITG